MFYEEISENEKKNEVDTSRQRRPKYIWRKFFSALTMSTI